MAEKKPKKLYEIKTTVWDDNEVTQEIVEIVQQDRGAPQKWMRTPSDFSVSLKRQTNMERKKLVSKFADLLGAVKGKVSNVSDEDEDDLDYEAE